MNLQKHLQKHAPKLIYLLLIAACIGIVIIVSRLAEPEPPGTESAGTEVTATESEAATASDIPEETEADESLATETIPSTEYDEWWPDYRYHPGRGSCGETEAEVLEEEPYMPPVLMIATDLHYYSEELTDGGEAFMARAQRDDGKILWYSDAMIDALLDEALRLKPSALILTGDITYDGEKENHLRLAEKLARVQEEVQVLVIPGNHDLKGDAAFYYEDERITAENVDGEGFLEIYYPFGYEQAFSRDEASLSYMYAFDETHWGMMLDTCQYDNGNRVNGKIKAETLVWIQEQLEDAKQSGVQVLPFGHHNLLYQSRLYTYDCTMENHMDLLGLFESYRLPLYISGHLHAQRIKEFQEAPGIRTEWQRITEVVLSPYSIPVCHYGRVAWDDEDRISLTTGQVSVSDWARREGSTNEELLNFDELAPEWSKQIIKEQARKTLNTLPEEQKESMASLYADVYYNYTKGFYMSKAEIEESEAWALWLRMEADPVYTRKIMQMADDCQKNHLEWNLSQ